ncbi:hypothetical protein D9M71_326080 [compost metagenome]
MTLLLQAVLFFQRRQQRQQGGRKTYRPVAAGLTRFDIDGFRRNALFEGQGNHWPVAFKQRLAAAGRGIEHAQPQVHADGIVATLGAIDRIAGQGAVVAHRQPVGRQALGSAVEQQFAAVAGQLLPERRQFGKAVQHLRWQVAGVQPGALCAGKAAITRQQHHTDAGQRPQGLCGNPPEHLDGQFAVLGHGPQAPGFQQAVGQPQVGIAGIVSVQHAPFAFFVLTPLPRRQLLAQVATGEVVLGPVEQLFKALVIVRHQGEEQPVRLPFRGADAPLGRVDHPPVRADQVSLELLPGRPATGRRERRAQPQRTAQQPFRSGHSLPSSRRRRATQASRRQATTPSRTMLSTAPRANSTGW